ncbi:MAG: beta-hydroxyacyl-ACP dehydratase [Phycisphaerae bacterium]|nr:beta-hydroxyacyl-ACP dehydratase [Phycisphaerae bacterium]
MHFDFVDAVLEISTERIVTLKNISAAEEYLQDHFPTFPVLPGVLMVESMVQAARRLLESRDASLGRYVLGGVRALKYGALVRPGESMRLEVTLLKNEGDGYEFKGAGTVQRPAGPSGNETVTCVSGRFNMRPVRLPGRQRHRTFAECNLPLKSP